MSTHNICFHGEIRKNNFLDGALICCFDDYEKKIFYEIAR